MPFIVFSIEGAGSYLLLVLILVRTIVIIIVIALSSTHFLMLSIPGYLSLATRETHHHYRTPDTLTTECDVLNGTSMMIVKL